MILSLFYKIYPFILADDDGGGGILSAIKKCVLTVINFLGSLFDLIETGFKQIISFIQFTIESIADAFDLLSTGITILNLLRSYCPPFMLIFINLFLLACVLRLVVDLL